MCTFQILAAYVGDGKGAWMKRRIQWYYPRGGPEAGAKGEVKKGWLPQRVSVEAKPLDTLKEQADDGVIWLPPSRLWPHRNQAQLCRCKLGSSLLKSPYLNCQPKSKAGEPAGRNIQAEQEEEFISNTLFKKIQALQKEKETLAVNYEKEEEFLTNELSRKLMQLQHEKAELEQHLEQEQEFQVNKLMKKIKKLENDTISKQLTLEQLRREKIDLENTLEQEQEALVNRLWKRMDKLEAEKRDISMEIDSPENMMRHIRFLKNEVERLKKQLRAAQLQHSEKMAQYLEEERHMREENLRLQRKLQREMERREALCRQLSESESSLEMDDESQVRYDFRIQEGDRHGTGLPARPSPRRSNSPDKFKRPTPPPSPNTQTPVQPPPPPPPPPMQPTVPSAATSQPAPSQHSVHPSSQP
ncbi:Coiled-coil domain-containing protein 6-like protein [Camelus ferus]|nr:Coiled-coil domain-containing protein 6-like protein [Camelus ferus]